VREALLAYNEGNRPDFLLVELRAGRLTVSVDDGSGNVTWTGQSRLDNGQWHLVELHQRGQKHLTITVNDQSVGSLAIPNYVDRRNVFDMFGPLYVGGLPAHMLQSRRAHGLGDVNAFIGCLATLTVSGQLHNPINSLPPGAVSGCPSKQPMCSLLCKLTSA